ncbi:MAG: T9SS type A sorting domain-containing protein [Saprospiraceae bacterium]
MKIFTLLTSFFLLVNISYAQFAPPVIITDQGAPSDITSADFNQDGWIDLAYVQDEFNVDTPRIYIVLNDGEGNFLPPSYYIQDIKQGFSVGAGDLNGDGIPDLATQGETELEFNWYAGNGDGTFSTPNIIQASLGGNYIARTAIFDLDANGHNDIVIVNRGTPGSFGFVGWFKNNGGGNIDTLATIFDELQTPFGFDFGDLDGDIYPDVVIGQETSGEAVIIFDYDGSGGFTYEALDTDMDHAIEVLIADLNLDGVNEILASDNTDDGIFFWERVPFLGDIWSAQNDLLNNFTNIVSGMDYRDLDGDGKPDFVYSVLTGEVGYCLNETINESINFGSMVELFTAPSLSVTNELEVIDSDNDIDFDIVVISRAISTSTPVNQVTHLRNLLNDESINGQVFWDENENGILDNNENLLPNFPIQLSPSSLAVFTNTEGSFQIFADAGNYELIPNFGDCWASTTGGNVMVNFDGVNTIEDILVGVKQISTAENVQVSLTSSATRCGFTVPFWMNYTNTGCEVISGKIKMLPSDLTTLISFGTPPDQTVNDTLIWNFENLIPGENRQVDLAFEIAGVQNLGDTIAIPLQFVKENIGGNFTTIDSSVFTSIINCAYDPNDKQTYPRRSEIAPYDQNYTLMEERIDYTVRFQNTGTDTAFTVVIRDTLSSDLDWSTFQPLSASHPFETVFHDNGAIEFFFKNILLVDSFTNEPMSHGYVQFNIFANDNLPDETFILNSASIYFDFNPPILTNTVENLMVDMLPVYTSTNEISNLKGIQFFPNPIAIGETLNLKDLPDGEKQISVFNNLGQLMFFEKTHAKEYFIQSEKWRAGVYFVLIENENERMFGKVVVN